LLPREPNILPPFWFKKAHRKVYNHVPYGYAREGDALVGVAAEQAVVARVRLWRANGWTLRRIAQALNADGVPTKLGGRWFAQTVKDVVTNSLHEAVA
jgi:site-specific DNA recombinase